MSFGNQGSKAWYWDVKMGYSAGTMLRTYDRGTGIMATVPLIVPVVRCGYWLAMGFGDDSEWQKRVAFATQARAAMGWILMVGISVLVLEHPAPMPGATRGLRSIYTSKTRQILPSGSILAIVLHTSLV